MITNMMGSSRVTIDTSDNGLSFPRRAAPYRTTKSSVSRTITQLLRASAIEFSVEASCSGFGTVKFSLWEKSLQKARLALYKRSALVRRAVGGVDLLQVWGEFTPAVF